MSYINDALHKAQKERESPYTAYESVLAVRDKKPGRSGKRVWVASLIAALAIMAGLVLWLIGPTASKTPPDAIARKESKAARVEAVPGGSADLQERPAFPHLSAASVPVSLFVDEPVSSTAASTPPVEKEEGSPAEISEALPKKASPPPSPATDPARLYTRALQKQREGKLEEARDLYRQVLQAEPRHLQALNNLGVVHLKMKSYQRAVIRFNDALKVKPEYVDAHYNLACLYAQNNDTKKSLLYLKNAIDINPEVRQWAEGDDDLKAIAHLPEFKEMVQAD